MSVQQASEVLINLKSIFHTTANENSNNETRSKSIKHTIASSRDGCAKWQMELTGFQGFMDPGIV